MNKQVKKIEFIYKEIKSIIVSRLNDFKIKWEKGRDIDIFSELVFCILTPQSKAKTCWNAVENLINKKLLLNGNKKKIANELVGVRFKYKKSEYIINARNLFLVNNKIKIKPKLKEFDNSLEMREWLVKNIKGYGYKEASHFLRNIGFGSNLAILDRHILKNLKLMNVIEEIPSSISKKKYFDIENKMLEFSNKIKIPMEHLDLLLWYKETNEVFK